MSADIAAARRAAPARAPPPVWGGARRAEPGPAAPGGGGVGEVQAGPVDLDQAQLLGRREGPRAWPGAVAGGRARVRAVGHRGQQQRGLYWLGQGGEPGGEDGGQPVSQGQRLGGPPPTGG